MLALSPVLRNCNNRAASGTALEGGMAVASIPAMPVGRLSEAALVSPVSPGLVSGREQAASVKPRLVDGTDGGFQQSTASAPSSSSNASLPTTVLVEDPIHGSHTITEAVLIELLLSKPVDRLRRVLQHGITGLIGMTPSPPVTRYEHSVGAMLIVRAAGGTIEAQAAALLHDIAHTALSHVVDGVFGYVVHEDDKMEYLNTTTVPDILTKHGLIAEDVLEESNYPLLELDSPAICADRGDYGIRDSLAFGITTLDEARSISRDLVASREGRLCFKSSRWAKRHAEAYMEADAFAWSHPAHSILYAYAADTIRLAHSTGRMKKCDLWDGEGDEVFWHGMTESADPQIRKLASRVKPSVRVEEISAGEYEEGRPDSYYKTKNTKARTIDPDVLQPDGSVKRLSQLSEEYRLSREAYLKQKSGVHYYRVLGA